MSFYDRINADPVGDHASNQDIMPEESNSQTSLQHHQHSDLVAMPTLERILACGVNHWLNARKFDQCLLSFDFTNEEQGIIPVKTIDSNGETEM